MTKVNPQMGGIAPLFRFKIISSPNVCFQYLNNGLKHFDAMFFVPNFMVSLTVITSISGGIFFQEFINFDIVQFIFYPVGLLCTVVGVFILSQRDAAKKAEQLDVPMNVVVGAMSPRRRRKSSNARSNLNK